MIKMKPRGVKSSIKKNSLPTQNISSDLKYNQPSETEFLHKNKCKGLLNSLIQTARLNCDYNHNLSLVESLYGFSSQSS